MAVPVPSEIPAVSPLDIGKDIYLSQTPFAPFPLLTWVSSDNRQVAVGKSILPEGLALATS